MTPDMEDADIEKEAPDGGIAERDSYSITYDESTDTYHVSIDPNERVPVGVTAIQAIATITQTDPLELEPLVEYIDPDHLQGLFDSTQSTTALQPTVSFSYIGYRITIESPTEVRISP